VVEAERFLARRGWTPRRAPAHRPHTPAIPAHPETQSAATALWQSFGPAAVQTASYGLVTGRVSALALDPSDPTGNRLYLGTTGGGVWVAQNAGAANVGSIDFTPLTDTLQAMSGAQDASISIGALTVQPGGTGVILAGTGDPNDNLDSYYGAGILRSTDGGNTWSLITKTMDREQGLSGQDYSFIGEGFAGFAWSTATAQRVVAAVSQALEGTLVDAEQAPLRYQGLYYSSDSGATWHLATISDASGADVQGPADAFVGPDGNAATSVVWNPIRNLFVAAVRYHGYYQSADGITWTRLAAQPGAGLTLAVCPTSPISPGVTGCPIFRGSLAVNPLTGDTFAWTVDAYRQDQGLWQDQCQASAGLCANPLIAFQKQWDTTALEANNYEGPATIVDGDYTLALAAVPSGQDTLLLAGDDDLWKCSLAMGCAWRNTTNSTSCMSAQVAEYQHALAWNAGNPLEVFLGTDGGLWRSTDAIGETGAACASTDASHFQNLNGALGSLAEVVSMVQPAATPYTVLAGLGANGAAGVKGNSATAADWPQVLAGEGGPVAIGPVGGTWFVNTQTGVSIYACEQAGACTPAAFGTTPAVSQADVDGDGLTMPDPAPFIVDPLDPTQLLIGTCRVWRGPANGSSWGPGNAISPILDGDTANTSCQGDALIRSIAAMPVGANEVVYVGMYGSANGGATLPGHVLTATIDPASSATPVWTDLTSSPVASAPNPFNFYGLDISSIVIDPGDATGNTVYVTVAGFASAAQEVDVLYRSTDGGAHWAYLNSNLPEAPANSLVIDPQDSNTIYIATDVGVYSTRQVGTCATAGSSCWTAFGAGLPLAPVVALGAAPAAASSHLLTAATYGRGIWQIPLWTAGLNLTTATATPSTLTFPSQPYGSASLSQPVAVKNTGSAALMVTGVAASGDFSTTDTCQNVVVPPGASCTVQVTFLPTQIGTRTGQLTVSANIAAGSLTVSLSGTGAPSGAIGLTPATLPFGNVNVGAASGSLPVTAENVSTLAVALSGFTIAGPFSIATNACGASLAPGASCAVGLVFSPTQGGTATGTLTLTDAAGTQNVQLSGNGLAAATDSLSTNSLAFPGTGVGVLSAALTVTLTNGGGQALAIGSVSVTGPFQASNNCGGSLAGLSSCTIGVNYLPTQLGSQTGTLTVTDALRQQTVSLSGTGLPPPVLAVSPATFSFPQQQVNQPSAAAVFTVSNTGGAPMTGVGFQITGVTPASFSTGTTTCGAVLDNGGSCTVQVVFNPPMTGGSAATLVVSSASSGVAAATAALAGTGSDPASLNVNPAQLVFPVVVPGQTSVAQSVAITNNGAALGSVKLSLPLPFLLVQNGCAGGLPAGGTCTAGVVFAPTVDGVFSDSMTIAAPSLAIPASVIATGTGGVPGAVNVLPALVNFPQTGVGIPSNPVTVTLTNPSGTASLTGLTLAASAGFMVASSACGSTLAPLKSCTASVAFKPLSAGPQTGSLTVSSSTLTGGAFVPLSGLGFDFMVAPNGSASQAVASGQTASYALTITPLGGSQGVFALACGQLPANSKCVFNPATVGVAANSTGAPTLNIETGLAATIAVKRGWPESALPLACGLLLLPFALLRRRALLPIALLFILAGGLSSCTASSGGTGGIPIGGTGTTPAGTYSIPITVQSNGVIHTTALTLTVD
jgi:hypothetical protein